MVFLGFVVKVLLSLCYTFPKLTSTYCLSFIKIENVSKWFILATWVAPLILYASSTIFFIELSLDIHCLQFYSMISSIRSHKLGMAISLYHLNTSLGWILVGLHHQIMKVSKSFLNCVNWLVTILYLTFQSMDIMLNCHSFVGIVLKTASYPAISLD